MERADDEIPGGGSLAAGAVAIRSPADIRPAAIHVRDVAARIANLRVAATDNIAARVPMRDEEGEVLATTVFAWDPDGAQWWQDVRFGLRAPVAEACRVESRPFWANRDGARDRDGTPILRQFDFAAHYGRLVENPAGIVVPVHLPFSRIGMVSFSCRDNRRDDLSRELDEHFETLYLLGHLFIEGYARLETGDRWLPDAVTLTRLEVNCLRWVARGKTDDEIATIMGRARPTIRFHLQNAAIKLGAANRSQAVFRAGQLGYLSAGSAPQAPALTVVDR
ncbi:regulatory protein, LuxR [Rhizorhabdus wittichii RW1]|uniref:Regulatory protein, LuxR n=1 Tax=Rhizorhabdus wittichii (strain DSM 6014 / CCUG 31198 / JCM 15750 / NBRC 105917 / EY 4224 / RW1) TaxID=392499 RepID=A0A9J9LCE2_RHIWR|nr:regulatory protein, LuxR [Rhizorhabdus wittichii RW1]